MQVIRLTKAGRAEFRKMAAEHESWIADVFGDLTPKDVRELMRLLAKTKASARKSPRRRGRCSSVEVAGVDYEVEYNNRARVPEHPAADRRLGKGRSRLSRAASPALDVYGPGARNIIDFFPADQNGPIVVFIHGGYWQALDGSVFSHLAGGLSRRP